MKTSIRRLLRLGPSVAEQDRAALEGLGQSLVQSVAAGLRDPRPLTATEVAEVTAYAGCVTRRSFFALYDDEG
ncbi:hypothetical protein ACFV3N_01570 [Streptomyces bauhiniae]|uniref:hypothetical protein n=1 Tax=Streptomyces bauhiniae TaxID=2340725 RepID=UPI003667DC3C